jgi:hypothetical protein
MASHESPPPAPKLCPNCTSPNIKAVLETNYGAYWRCAACGNVWHEDTRLRPKLPPLFECRWTPRPFGECLFDLRGWLTPAKWCA